ncbi:hypothetical protein CPB83DRAFT_892814 [Crepidotus variabilis]|uniref:Uncharacterized protein n=1 Tax=Crepidotus variabilis TaxID=179855 RepID=A0A9P6JS54_9AGAR|nr:hypothetical protein CPB83DRAFT_892814 [Crepidotus variabilis]
MVVWNSVSGWYKAGAIYVKLSHALSGIFIWELLTTLGFEWDFLTFKKKFRWPLIFYFLNRYAMLATLCLNLQPSECRMLEAAQTFLGSASIGLANINMTMRTVAIWNKSRYINIFLGVLITVHWVMIAYATNKARYADFELPGECLPSGDIFKWHTILFSYATGFNLVVLILNVYKLLINQNTLSQSPKTLLRGKSRVAHLLFTQGLVYFIVACLANIIAIVFMCMNFNDIMSVMFTFPAQVFSTIVACRSVRELTNHAYQSSDEVNRLNKARMASTSYGRGPTSTGGIGYTLDHRKLSSSSLKDSDDFTQSGGVLVHMETLVQSDAEFLGTRRDR